MALFHFISSIGLGKIAEVAAAVIAALKDIKIIPDSANNADYNAFGTLIKTGADRVTYFTRIGTDHTNGGKHYMLHYTPSTSTWGNRILIDDSLEDIRDVYGGNMDNGETIIFSCTKAVTDNPAVAFFRKAPAGSVSLGPRVQVCGGTTGHPSYHVNFPFGKLTAGAAAGEYYQSMYHDGTGDANNPHKVVVIKTLDYFATWTIHEMYSGTISYTETAIAYVATGKLIGLARVNQGSHLHHFDSLDSGVTWVRRGAVKNLGWHYNKPKIPHMFMHNGLLNVLYHDRDALWTLISKDNDPALVFGSVSNYKPSELYYYNTNGGVNGNPSLGYPSTQHIDSGKFLVALCREESGTNADVYFTLDDFVTDPGGVPVAPPTLGSSNITSSSFSLGISGYTTAEMQNIRFFELDVATDAAFTTFASAKLNGTTNGEVLITFQNIRMLALWVSVQALSASTTYYARIRACNNKGKSAYTSISVTTTT